MPVPIIVHGDQHIDAMLALFADGKRPTRAEVGQVFCTAVAEAISVFLQHAGIDMAVIGTPVSFPAEPPGKN